MIDEIVKWGVRLFALLPEIMGLWEAVRTQDAKRRLDAQLALVRAMSDLQAREEIEGS